MTVDPQIIPYVAALISVITALAGLVHKGNQDRIKDRDGIIAEQKAVIARLQAEADKAVQAKDAEIAEWRKRAFAEASRSVP